MLDVQHDLAGLCGALFHVEIDVAPDHHGGKLLHCRAFGIDRTDVFTLAQHGAAVGHRHDLIELVRDEENGLSLRREIFHDLHQLFDLLRGQNRSRFVEDQDLVIAVEHLEDLRALLHTHGDVFDQCVRINLQAVLLRQRQNLFARLLLLKKAVLVRLHAEDDVVQHREALYQLEVLVYHADAEIVGVVRILDGYDLAVFFNGTLLRLVQAEQHRHERGFTGAVFTQQRVDFTLFELQRDIVVGDDAWEPFGDVQHFNGILSLQVKRPPSVFMARARRFAGTETILRIACQ